MNEDYEGAQSGNMRADLKDTITQLGIEYRLMTQFTSFVAVEEMVVTDGGQPRRIDVPVEVPYGTKDPEEIMEFSKAKTVALPKQMRVSRGVLSGGASSVPPARADSVIGASNSDVPAFGTLPPPTVKEPVVRTELIGGLKDEALRQKLHVSLVTIVEKLQRKETLTAADERGFIRNGKAEVQVWLSDKSPASLAKLKQVGFEVVLDAKSSKLIIGRLPVEKLETLARLDFVKYVSPQITK
jgi:hypothetical protein